MKLRRIQFAQQHVNWTRDQWLRVLYSDESCIQQFGSRNHSVGKLFDDKYSTPQQTMKHSPNIMIWGAMSVKRTAWLFFLTPTKTMVQNILNCSRTS